MKTTRDLTIIGILVSVVSIFSFAFAESGIENRQIFVGTNVRALGMGSAFTAGPSSSGSLFWNPSALGFLGGAEVSLVGLPFSEESTDREGAFSLALTPQQLGIATKNIGNISISSWFDGWGNDDKANRMMLVGYGHSFGKNIAAGATLRHHRRNRALRTQFGWSFDLGLLFSHKFERLGDEIAFGLTFEDLGGHIWENWQLIEKMSPVTRFGTTYYLDDETILSGDIVLHNDKRLNWRDRYRTHLGAEKWLFNRRFGARIGYTAVTNYDRFAEGEWSRGFSLRNESAQFDYAYVSGNGLGQGIHWISATLRWGGSPTEVPIAQPLVATPTDALPMKPAPILMPKQVQAGLNVSEEAISPNGDGVKDWTIFDLEITEDAVWQLEIRGAYSEIVQTYSGTGWPLEAIQWDGRNAAGNLVSDGKYSVLLSRFDKGGSRYPKSKATITVDTTPADIAISAEPLILVSQTDTPSRGNLASDGLVVNVPTVHVRASDLNQITDWELRFLDGTGNAIDRMQGEGEPPNTVVWNNWHKHPLSSDSNSRYRCALTVHDPAGNPATHEATLPLIDLRGKNAPNQREAMKGRKGERGIVLTLPGVAFDSNSYKIRSDYRRLLEKTAQTIAAYPDAQVVIEGHSDNVGNASYNLELSRKRANAVMTYLVDEFGIQPSRLSAIGYGEEQPIVANNIASNRRKNRRVEIVLLTVQGASTAEESLKAEGEIEGRSSPGNPLVQRLPQEEIITNTTFTPTYTLLVSSFKNRGNAELLVASLEALNPGGDIRLSRVMIQSKPWYRVTIGRFHNKKDAAALIREIKRSQGIEPLVISERWDAGE